jgi:N-acetylmuramoyl-L-alanine amidase
LNINSKYLSINKYTRDGRLLNGVLGIVMHYPGKANQTARGIWNYWESEATKGKLGYTSAHYVIDLDGTILQCIPLNERAYHCGTSKKDPVSKKVYTDKGRELFGKYCSFPNLSPNQVTIGIEICHTDNDGNYNNKTILSAIDLVSYLCGFFQLSTNRITTHNEIVGWKECPKLWTNKPYLFEAFKNDVKVRLQNGR